MQTEDILKEDANDEAFLGSGIIDEEDTGIDEVPAISEVEETLALLHQGESDEVYEFFVDEEDEDPDSMY
jgi:hypothetical protein